MASRSLAVGDPAPDFEAPSTVGDRVVLSSYRGQKNVVLFFYPGDFTPVCTKEACAFRDIYDELRGQDTEVIGISTDDQASHTRFAAAHDLTFPLVADTDRAIARRYGAGGLIRNLLKQASRVTYVIDKEGKIVKIIQSELMASKHVNGVKEALAGLTGR